MLCLALTAATEESRLKPKPEGGSNSVKEGDAPRQQKDRAFMGHCRPTRHSPTLDGQHARNHHIPPFALPFSAS